MPENSNLYLNHFSKTLLLGLVFLVAIGLPLSLLRIYDTGFQPVYAIHIAITFSVIVVFLLREKISDKLSILFTTLIFFGISIAGAINYGLASHFLVYANVALLIVSIIYGIKNSLIVMSIFLIFTAIVAYLYINGMLTAPVDLNVYTTSYGAWSLILFAGLFSNTMIFLAIGNMQQQLKSSIKKLNIEKQKVEQLANYDCLTGLATRRLSQDRIDMAINLAKRTGNKIALLFIDLDKFKSINDIHGHDAGDRVLVETAKRLNNIVRPSDTTSRLGGDEFLIVLTELTEVKSVEALCKRLLKELKQPIKYQDINLTVSASIGIAIYPDNTENVDQLKRLADKAMYQVKEHGRGNYRFSSTEAN